MYRPWTSSVSLGVGVLSSCLSLLHGPLFMVSTLLLLVSFTSSFLLTLSLLTLSLQVQIQRLGSSIVQRFQSRCDMCGGKGEIFNGTYCIVSVPVYYFRVCGAGNSFLCCLPILSIVKVCLNGWHRLVTSGFVLRSNHIRKWHSENAVKCFSKVILEPHVEVRWR